MRDAAVTEETAADSGIVDHNVIVQTIMERLTAFDKAIAESKILQIDGICINSKPCAEVTDKSRIKVLNSSQQAAYEVEVDTIIRTPLDDLMLALEAGVLVRLQGITRIVGYFSRISNWNKSKIGELHDRHQGNYAVNPCMQGDGYISHDYVGGKCIKCGK